MAREQGVDVPHILRSARVELQKHETRGPNHFDREFANRCHFRDLDDLLLPSIAAYHNVDDLVSVEQDANTSRKWIVKIAFEKTKSSATLLEVGPELSFQKPLFDAEKIDVSSRTADTMYRHCQGSDECEADTFGVQPGGDVPSETHSMISRITREALRPA